MAIDLLISAIKGIVIVLMVLNLSGILLWFERKGSALIQDRIGANRAAVFGVPFFDPLTLYRDAVRSDMRATVRTKPAPRKCPERPWPSRGRCYVRQHAKQTRKGISRSGDRARRDQAGSRRLYRPVREGGRYDMIFALEERLVRVQCKWAPRQWAKDYEFDATLRPAGP